MIRTAARSRQTTVPVAVALGLCGVTGVTMSLHAPVAPLIGAAAMLAALSLDWRRGVVALLVVLPFAGVPVFVAGTPGLAFRDLALVGPLYIMFAVAMIRSDAAVMPPLGIALPGLAVLAALVVFSLTRSPSLAVGVIGAKVWLAYVPMIAVGYHYLRTPGDWDRAVRLTALLGLVPAVIGAAEWFIAARYPHGGDWTNNFGPFRHMYGSWYEHMRTSAVAMSAGSHTFVVPRVPSTFTSGTQFYLFSMVAYAAGLSQALRGTQLRWLACAMVLAIGVVATGQRQAYVAMPAMTVLSLVLGGASRPQLAAMSAAGGGLLVVLFALGGAPLMMLSVLPDHAVAELTHAWQELRDGLRSGLIGHGTGWDTQAALRYGGSASERYIENWYSKAALELGIVGFAAVVTVLASLQLRLLTRLCRVDPATRRAAAPMCAMLLVMTATLFKGPVLDLDPMNVYFWLLTGMLLSLMRPRLTGAGAVPEEAPVRAEVTL